MRENWKIFVAVIAILAIISTILIAHFLPIYMGTCSDTNDTSKHQTESNSTTSSSSSAGDSCSSQPYSLAYTTGRKIWKSEELDLWFFTYANGTDFVYTTSSDGVHWYGINDNNKNPVWIREGEGILGMEGGLAYGYHIYWYLEERGGTTYVHYEYANENSGCQVKYRRGILNNSGLVTWDTDEQVVYDAPGAQRVAPEAIVVDNNGYPYIIYETGTDEPMYYNITNYLSKSKYNNGTWSTASGYPINVTYTKNEEDNVEHTLEILPNGDIVNIQGMSKHLTDGECSWNATIKCVIWNGTDLTVENASGYRPYYRDHFSTIVDNDGNIHLAYHAGAEQYCLYYCRRNYTTGTWDVIDALIQNTATYSSYIEGVKYPPQITYDADAEYLIVDYTTSTSFWGEYSPISSYNWSGKGIRIINFEQVSPAGNTGLYKTTDGWIVFAVQGKMWGYDHLTDIWLYLYDARNTYGYTVIYNSTESGWNVVSLSEREYGKNFSQVNGSLYHDNVNYTYFEVEWTNGTRWGFYFDWSMNADVVISDDATKIYIWAVTSGTWTHRYD